MLECDVKNSNLRPQPQENVTPDARQNHGATKIPLPLRAGDKKRLQISSY